jgi:hypothetical protein
MAGALNWTGRLMLLFMALALFLVRLLLGIGQTSGVAIMRKRNSLGLDSEPFRLPNANRQKDLRENSREDKIHNRTVLSFSVSNVKKPTETRLAIIVLGMHRSGTSMLTHLLSASGFSLPKVLINATGSNRKGHFESFNIVSYNERIMLEAFGMTWLSPTCGFTTATSKLKDLTAVLTKYKEGAVSLIRSEFQDQDRIVLKDPRISVLYDFWSDVLRECGYQPIPIIIVRHPLEVSTSLARRNKLSSSLSHAMWLYHSLAAERATRAGPRAFVLHADLMADWRKQLARLEAELAVPILARVGGVGDGAADPRDAVVSPELQSVGVHGGHGAVFIPDGLLAAYDWFALAAGVQGPRSLPAAAAAQEEIDGIWARWCAPGAPSAP